MLFIVGVLIILVSVIGLYGIHGNIGILWQPIEFGIIFGGAFGALLISSPMHVVKGVAKSMGTVLKGPKYKGEHYLELLGVLFAVFKLAKSKGDLALALGLGMILIALSLGVTGAAFVIREAARG